MHPVLFDIGLFGVLADPWELHTYGLMIASGFVVAMVLGSRQAEREGEDPAHVVDLAFYVLLAGLFGARLVFIVTKLDDYLSYPMEILYFWKGGLVFYGGFIAAGLYVLHYCRKHRLPFLKFADIIIPYLALAHAFGRLGCLAAGCCFGKPTDLPWGVTFPYGSMAQQGQQADGMIGLYDRALPVHPTQLYEAGAEFALFWVLLLLRGNKRFHGQLLLVWLGAYALLRSLIELFRGDMGRGVHVLSTSQYIAIGVLAFAVWLHLHLRRTRVLEQVVLPHGRATD